MYFKVSLFLAVSLCCMQSFMQAELLVVKKSPDGYLIPLDDQDSLKYGKIISETILRYQWPMCIASVLTDGEKDTLLSSGLPNAEELFIQNKLRELIPVDQIELSVIFVPTSVYELFCILQVAKGPNNNAFSHIFKKLLLRRPDSEVNIELGSVLWQGKNPSVVFKNIYNIYGRANNLFFDGEISAWLYINNIFVHFLFENYSALNDCKDGLEASRIIKHRSVKLGLSLIDELYSGPSYKGNAYSIGGMADVLKNNSQHHILQKTISLEYEARELNKGLLLRGSSHKEFQVGTGSAPLKHKLAGTTLWNEDEDINQAKSRVEQLYRKKEKNYYSISFGNSLFAGFFLDIGACAYLYLTNHTEKGQMTTGYALFIDKKDYMQHQNSRLFFISRSRKPQSFKTGDECEATVVANRFQIDFARA